MTVFPVSTAKLEALKKKMSDLGIREEDIEESFIRSSGHGGQKLNKTSSRVYLKHIPTGTEVKCQAGRSQSLNRYHARVILAKKIEAAQKGAESEEARRIARIRRQKKRRSRRLQEKILKEKKIVSVKKRLRSSVDSGESYE